MNFREIQQLQNRIDKIRKGGTPPVTAKDIEAIIAKSGGPVQTIRIEQAPLKITTDTKQEPYKM